MGRWTQYEEDASRLPEGFTRVGYDAETQRYKFKDRQGELYQSEPGESYGTLTPIADPSIHTSSERPEAFEDPARKRSTTLSPVSPTTAKTFQDFLPAEVIATSPTSSPEHHRRASSPTKSTPRDQFVSAVRRTALPKVQGVVTGLRRSMTSARNHQRAPEEEERGLLRSGSMASNATVARSPVLLDRTGSMNSDVSTVRPLSIESSRR